MIINRRKHWQFLEDELKAETEDFKKIYLATAISLLKISQEMYVAQFISFKDGEMIMQFPISRALPRRVISLYVWFYHQNYKITVIGVIGRIVICIKHDTILPNACVFGILLPMTLDILW